MDLSSLNITAPDASWPDRNNSPDSIIPRKGVIVVVDPVSTGACLAKELSERGHSLVRVWSDTCPDVVKNHTKAGTEVAYAGELQVHDSTVIIYICPTKHVIFAARVPACAC